VSRTLNDDFDDDLGDSMGGSLDLEKGSGQVGSGVASSYDGGGIDFDDELMGDDGPGHGALELDIPGGGRSAPPAGPSSGVPPVPDLAFGGAPSKAPPAAAPRGSLPPRTSGAPGRPSDSHQAHAGPQSHGTHPAGPASQSHGTHPAGPASPSAPPSHGAAAYPQAPPSSQDGGYPQALPPARPSAAAVIAKYPEPSGKILAAPMYAVRVVLRQLELRSDLESLRRRRSPDVPLYEAALEAYEPRTFRLGMAINLAALAVVTFIFFLPVIFRFMGD
jgi:hypothetical protein